ncbi:MAG: efflux RND transporter permease subunit [Cytophagaceae bacterium]|nr:efflux RND transporter permease subunit [Cytophagaceae bacterium]MDW8455207.1 efflux RND transporter permease subunit [Cytophagaceae bacterium]
MLYTFIKRPVLSIVISILIVLMGVLAYTDLPITQYPDIIPPSVTVTTRYIGANAEVCAKAVATPIERAINGVPGMTYMSTVSSNNGTTITTVYFRAGVDPDVAAVNVQNRVQTVIDELPEEVLKNGVSVEKEINSMLLYLNLMSTDTLMDEKFVYNFADINILPELKRIDGVGFAEIMGAQDYSMRVWLKPDRMAIHKVSSQDIIQAIRAQNIEAAPGRLGESSDKQAQVLEYVLKYTGKFFTPAQYENIVIRSYANGSILRLKDLAEVEFGSLSYNMLSKTDGKPSASIMLKQRPGSNAREVIQNVKNKMEQLKASIFPEGMYYNVAYDVSRFLDASIHEVVRTLIEAIILVFIVVFIFLQDLRSTIIPALAIPVSLIGTLFFMSLMDFSLNLLTLFALVLAIGIVVDNAIVVVEAVHTKMSKGLNARDATFEAIKEIGTAIISLTLVMSAVFVPIAFITGPVGVFYKQFSLTLAVAIVISGINALTLTPALCALMLKHHDTHTLSRSDKSSTLQKFFSAFNTRYTQLENFYKASIARIAHKKTITIGLSLSFSLLACLLALYLPTGFIPNEDQGMIYVNVTTPTGATVERTEKVLDKIQAIAKEIKSVESMSSLAGYSLISEAAGASYGMGMINLIPWNKRKESVRDIIEELNIRCKDIKDATIEFLPPPAVPGFGNASGFELRILDRTGKGDLQYTSENVKKFLEELEAAPEIKNVYTSFDATFPQYMIHILYDVAAKKGISVENAMDNLQTLVGSYYTSNFIRFGMMYKVMVQAHPKYRKNPEDILQMYVKNDRGEMVPYSTFIKLERVYGPEQLTRYNMFTSAMIVGEPESGFSSGDAIKAVQRIAKEKLPKGFTYEWSGVTREEIQSGSQSIYIFIICLVFVYLLLSAQYESFLLPLPVILSLPGGILGAYMGLWLMGLENNIYAQVAMVMLIGMLGKNAILIVEYAILKNKEGMSVLQASIEGASMRLRPIIMTSFAFIAGLVPLCLSSGAGALGNRSIGSAAAGGMLIGTIAGLIVIPGLYVIFAPKKIKR